MTHPLHIFRAGTHRSMSGHELAFGEDRIAGIARNYDPDLHEAPIVVGHPRADAPAYGWIGALRADGENLLAEPVQVEPQFAELVRAGRFKRMSASFYPPQAAANPVPGEYYLKHVGFLGAQPPAVKGLKAAEFGAGEDDAVTLELDFSEADIAGIASAGFGGLRRIVAGLRDWLLSSQGQETADRIVPAHELDHIRTTEEFMRNVIERDGGEAAVPSFAQTDLSRRLNARLDERAGDDEERSGLIDRMAEAAGIERSTVLQILRGEIATPPKERLRGFAKVLNMKVGDLVDLVDMAEQQEETDMSGKDDPTDTAARAADLDRRERELKAREAEFAESAARARRDEDAALIGQMAEDGRMAPGLKDEMLAFLEAIDGQDEVSFGEASLSPRDWFRTQLTRTRPLISFAEAAPAEDVPAVGRDAGSIEAAAKRIMKSAEDEGRALSFSEAAREAEQEMENTHG